MTRRKPFSFILTFALLLLVPTVRTVAGDGNAGRPPRKQLRTLAAPSEDGRFEMSYDRVWPETPGQAQVCLWADDKYAAVSISIDDNCQPDHG